MNFHKKILLPFMEEGFCSQEIHADKAMKNKRCTHIAYQSLCPSPFGIKAELIFSTFTFIGAVPKIQPIC